MLYECGSGIYLICINSVENDKRYENLDEYIIYNYKKRGNEVQYSTMKLNKLVADTLILHRLIDVDYMHWYADDDSDEIYELLFKSVSNLYEIDEDRTLDYEKGYIKLTKFGENFIEICLK